MAGHADISAIELSEILQNRQTKPAAENILGLGVLDPREFAEQPLNIFRRHTDARVGYGDGDDVVGGLACDVYASAIAIVFNCVRVLRRTGMAGPGW